MTELLTARRANICRILYDGDGEDLTALLCVMDEDGTEAMVRLNDAAAEKIAAILTVSSSSR